jgi:hypothetical protein
LFSRFVKAASVVGALGRYRLIHFHVSGIPETWKFGLIGSKTGTLFRVLDAGTKSLSTCSVPKNDWNDWNG